MSEKLRHDEYIKRLLEKRSQEIEKLDHINTPLFEKGEGFSSPTSAVSTEETRILMEYMEQQNLFNISSKDESKRKVLTLKKFFRMKRNQQVVIYSIINDEIKSTEGKVTAIGRDFVMLSNLKDRLWIPYAAINSANIPFGIPTYSNTHQHFLYDNDLRRKLLRNFGETVSKREELVQQFSEESLKTNLSTWKGSWIEVRCTDPIKIFGKIQTVDNTNLVLTNFTETYEVPISNIQYIRTLRFFQIARRNFLRLLKK